MIPASRISFVTVEDEHVEAHVARARGDGKDVVDRWPDGWSCTCFRFMVQRQRCDHIASVQALLPTPRSASS